MLLERQGWIAMLADKAGAAEPDEDAAPEALAAVPQTGWIAALGREEGFVEGLPIARIPEPELRPPSQQDTPPGPETVLEEPLEPAPPEPPETDPVEEARALGEAAGYAAAMAERDLQEAQRRKLQLTLRALDQAGLDALAVDLAATVKALCSQVLADYTPDPARLLERCEAAARAIGTGLNECALHLHPDDIALIEPDALAAWRVVEDAGVERGGLRFERPEGAVSDRPEDWRRAIAAAVGQ